MELTTLRWRLTLAALASFVLCVGLRVWAASSTFGAPVSSAVGSIDVSVPSRSLLDAQTALITASAVLVYLTVALAFGAILPLVLDDHYARRDLALPDDEPYDDIDETGSERSASL